MKGFLKQLSCCNKKSLPGIIKHACKKDLRRLINFTMEVMRKHVKVSPELARLIKQNRHVLRHIVHPLYSLKSKKQYLIQHGGGKVSRVIRNISKHMGATRTASTSTAGGAPQGMRMRSGVTSMARGQLEGSTGGLDSSSLRSSSRPEILPDIPRMAASEPRRWRRAPSQHLEAK